MDPKFIELHDKGAGEQFSINIAHIVSFGKEGVILMGIPTDIALATAESYDEIKQLIHDSGIHIQKADPRLDTSHPLTWNDLNEMVGQPVWNSNHDTWMIVKSFNGWYADMINTSGNVSAWEEEDLIHFPLYRMKKQRLVDALREVRGE